MDDVCAAMHAEEPLTCKRCKRGLVKPDIVFYGEELPARFGEVRHWGHMPSAGVSTCHATSYIQSLLF